MLTASLRMRCPAMPTSFVKFHKRQTAPEPMEAVFTFSDGSVVEVIPTTIPITPVNWKSFLLWMVDPCDGDGEQDGWKFNVKLPEEPVVIRLSGIVAKAMIADGVLTSPNGFQFIGKVNFPDCRTSWNFIADEIYATGQFVQAQPTDEQWLAKFFHRNEVNL